MTFGLLQIVTCVVVAACLGWSDAATSTLLEMIESPSLSFIANDNATTAVNLGVWFSPRVSGFVTAVMFYKNNSASIERVCSLFTTQGTLLGRATLPLVNETVPRTWQICHFDTPVAVTANVDYISSVWTYGYVASRDWFGQNDLISGELVLRGFNLNSVFLYGPLAFPTAQFNANYWINVRFESATAAPTPRPTPRPTPQLTPRPTPEIPLVAGTTSRAGIISGVGAGAITIQSQSTSTHTAVNASTTKPKTTERPTEFPETPSNTTSTAIATANSLSPPIIDTNLWIGVGVGLFGGVLVFLIVLAVVVVCRRKKANDSEQQTPKMSRWDSPVHVQTQTATRTQNKLAKPGQGHYQIGNLEAPEPNY
jgi:hypothetical protein